MKKQGTLPIPPGHGKPPHGLLGVEPGAAWALQYPPKIRGLRSTQSLGPTVRFGVIFGGPRAGGRFLWSDTTLLGQKHLKNGVLIESQPEIGWNSWHPGGAPAPKTPGAIARTQSVLTSDRSVLGQVFVKSSFFFSGLKGVLHTEVAFQYP